MKNKLFEKLYIDNILQLNCLEADDCIALAVKEIQKIQNDKIIYIITNDHDYLQLKTQYVFLYNLKFKELVKKSRRSKIYLKSVCGEKSDNIQSIFVKPLTCLKNLDNL